MARVLYFFREICCTNELVIYNFVHCNVFDYLTIKVHAVELKSVWVGKETFKTESKLIKTQFQKNSFSQLLSIFHALFQSFLYKIHNWFASSVEPVEYMWHRKKISFSFEIGSFSVILLKWNKYLLRNFPTLKLKILRVWISKND